MTRKPYPDRATVRHLFTLRRGSLYWRIRPSMGIRIGALAGHARVSGSRVIVISRKGFLADRLIEIYQGAV
jgi:hypothetical protein